MTEQQPKTANEAPHRISRAGFFYGMRATWVLIPGVVVFAFAFGAGAAAKGLSLLEAVLMSALVYAGVAQLVAMELWRPEWTWGAIAGVGLVAATVNARMVLQGASLQSWFGHFGKGANAAQLFLFTDANWLIGTRYHSGGGRDLGVMFGVGVSLWLIWVLATIPGYLLGALIPDPRKFGIDLVMPVFFAAMIVPMWRGPRLAVPWLVAGVVALATARLIDGYAFIVVGSLAGAFTGAMMRDEP